jgi:hypothetical protein
MLEQMRHIEQTWQAYRARISCSRTVRVTSRQCVTSDDAAQRSTALLPQRRVSGAVILMYMDVSVNTAYNVRACTFRHNVCKTPGRVLSLPHILEVG